MGQTDKEYKRGFDAGYQLGLREGFSEGRAVSKLKELKKNSRYLAKIRQLFQSNYT